ncbi:MULTISPECIES: hypothetical protein [unclassified Acinetobacter]|uniref:hypothetical protein n=1 Tax=unclassified Acinetobacter TaxID=196816 RepID=UPI0025763589|nr:MULTISPECIES: hypothetical protein [unclassified Acinetobacter]MDM1763401.1 hypothetical protein [Acinetobacter sp. 226-1]MDM1766880.1 hypothetical protein [Acinetobacter sp. 226-4]
MITKRLVISSALFFLTIGLTHADDSTLKLLSDSELSQVQGQALMNLTYTDPSKANASMASQNIGFYKLGMEADVELNANIKKLQLGCGGVNGAGGCDIDIDNLSLSGLAETREGRVGSSAKMTNPFIEFAIKNPNSASTREMMGFRLSAEKVLGMLTLGEENTGTPNGINSLSGYMKIKETTGTAFTGARTLKSSDVGGQQISGKIRGIGTYGFNTTDYNLNLQSTQADILVGETAITGSRINSAQLKGSANINELFFNGGIKAQIQIFPINLVSIPINAKGSITGLKADLDISENLGFIHKINLNNPFSLSLQKQDINWSGSTVAARRGWWLAIEDPIDIGHLNPTDQVQITNDVLSQVIQPLSTYLTDHPTDCSGITIISCVGGVTIPPVNLAGQTVKFPLKDIQLATQNFAPNCYGSLKFC